MFCALTSLVLQSERTKPVMRGKNTKWSHVDSKSLSCSGEDEVTMYVVHEHSGGDRSEQRPLKLRSPSLARVANEILIGHPLFHGGTLPAHAAPGDTNHSRATRPNWEYKHNCSKLPCKWSDSCRSAGTQQALVAAPDPASSQRVAVKVKRCQSTPHPILLQTGQLPML